MKNVAVSLMAIFFAACSGNKSPHSLQQEKEDLSAKGLLQGIWLDDETESPLMRVEGDTIYYADVQSTPIAFKIIRDTLYTYGNDTTYYKIDKQAEHIFWFHSITDDVNTIKIIPYERAVWRTDLEVVKIIWKYSNY